MTESNVNTLITSIFIFLGILVQFAMRYLSHREHKDGTTITEDTNKRARRIEKAMNGRIEKE